MPVIVDIYQSMIKGIKNQVLRKHVKLASSQNVNPNVMGTTFVPTFWFKLVQMFTRLMSSINLRHQHLAGVFFLALTPDNSFV